MKPASSFLHLFALLSVLLTTTGCHARYKKMAGRIGSVKPMVADPGLPVVNVDGVNDTNSSDTAVEGVLDAVVGVGLAVKATKVQARLQRAVTPEDAAAVLHDGILGAPAKGQLPHRIGPKGRHEMEIRLVQYGVGINAFGPSIDTTVNVRIDRKRDGKRVYRASTTCTERLSDVSRIVLPGVKQVQALQALTVVEEMKRAELRDATLRGVERCAHEVVERMVRHAR